MGRPRCEHRLDALAGPLTSPPSQGGGPPSSVPAGSGRQSWYRHRGRWGSFLGRDPFIGPVIAVLGILVGGIVHVFRRSTQKNGSIGKSWRIPLVPGSGRSCFAAPTLTAPMSRSPSGATGSAPRAPVNSDRISMGQGRRTTKPGRRESRACAQGSSRSHRVDHRRGDTIRRVSETNKGAEMARKTVYVV